MAAKTLAEPHAPSEAAAGGVIAVTRALQLLEAFQMTDAQLSLAELARRAGIHKTTALRIARTLAQSGYLVQRDDDGGWRLGPAAGWLGARYQASFDADNAIEPTLLSLTRETAESASFFVREGNARTCLVRVEGPRAIRHHIRMGEVLPLDKGSPGRVLLAFSGESGRTYEKIRRDGYYISVGERDSDIASVSAPVYGNNWRLFGALSVSGPAARLPNKTLRAYAQLVMKRASELSYALGGSRQGGEQAKTNWHP